MEGLADGERVVLERWSSWGWRKEGLERRGEKGLQEDELASVEVSGDELGASHAEVKVGLEAPSGWGPATRPLPGLEVRGVEGASVFLGELPPRFWWGGGGPGPGEGAGGGAGPGPPGPPGLLPKASRGSGSWTRRLRRPAPGSSGGGLPPPRPGGGQGGLLVFRPQEASSPPHGEEVALLGPGIHWVEPLPGLRSWRWRCGAPRLRTKRLRCWGRVGKAPFAGRKTPVEVADWLMPTPEAVALLARRAGGGGALPPHGAGGRGREGGGGGEEAGRGADLKLA